MDDLISRAWLLSEYDKRHKGSPGGARKLIEEAPSAQPKRGRWIDITNDESIDTEFKCSECGWELFLWSRLTNFCPSCGADMRGDSDE